MDNKIVNSNAREALNQIKMEIANELGMEVDILGVNKTYYDNGK